jgi:hypothetical protein
MASVRGGVVFPHLGTLPSTNKDGWVHYQGNGLWLNDGSKWKQVGLNYSNVNAGQINPTIYTISGTTNSSGSLTIVPPSGLFTSIHQVQCTTLQPSASNTTAAWVSVMTASTTNITVRTWQGSATVLLNASAATAAPNVGVQLMIVGS